MAGEPHYVTPTMEPRREHRRSLWFSPASGVVYHLVLYHNVGYVTLFGLAGQIYLQLDASACRALIEFGQIRLLGDTVVIDDRVYSYSPDPVASVLYERVLYEAVLVQPYAPIWFVWQFDLIKDSQYANEAYCVSRYVPRF